MVKKRFVLAVFIVLFTILLTSVVFAGCCVGVASCSRAFFESECSSLSAFDNQDCEAIKDCDVVACCHDVVGIPKATYRATCMGMGEILMHPISPFVTNPAVKNAEADKLCSQSVVPCRSLGCEAVNEPGCFCGSAQVTEDSPYCCAVDNSIFSNVGMCSVSPGCVVTEGFTIFGIVETSEGKAVPGATVTAGGKSALTDESGAYTLINVPAPSSGNVIASKNGVTNSTEYTLSDSDFEANIILDVSLQLEKENDCTDGVDSDGDQFGWDSMHTPPWNTEQSHKLAADRCDPDCAGLIQGQSTVAKDSLVVTSVYYSMSGEYDSEKNVDLCADGYDNDCDGQTDCQDPDCKNSPSCSKTSCGDGFVQFPNALGVYEQCDATYKDGVLVSGNDSLCPGQCLPAGDPHECTCFYDAVCGNNIVDEPIEECDGEYIAALDAWGSVSSCPTGVCGKPGSPHACLCPPTELCGNGIREGPEECDPGDFFTNMEPDNPAYKSSVDSQCPGECSPDCTCPEVSVCGDNILQQGEDCDGIWKNYGSSMNEDNTDKSIINIINNKFNGLGYWESFKTRKYGCVATQCGPPEWVGNSGGRDYANDVSRNYNDYESFMSSMIGSCKCPTDCKQDPPGPTLAPIEITQWEKRFDLSWSDDCSDNVKNYNIYRCEADDVSECDPSPISSSSGINLQEYSIVNDVPLSLTFEYTDSNFVPENSKEYFCYVVEGIYDTDSSLNKDYSVFDSEVHCVKVGDSSCYKVPMLYEDAFGVNDYIEFCSDEVRSTCDENNSIIDVVPENPLTEIIDCGSSDMFCVGPYISTEKISLTECVDGAVCDMCSSPFGLFSFSSDKGTFSYPMLGKLSPSKFHGKVEDPMSATGMIKSCPAVDYCYIDFSDTSVDVYKGANSGSSCYDMKSLDACAWFNKSELGREGCEWTWSTKFEELGVGVCRPVDPDEQDCSLCHDPLNEIFGHCDKDMCSLYGRCYYDYDNLDEDFESDYLVRKAYRDNNGNYFKCRHEREISCSNFDWEDDCINSSSPYSLESTAQLNQNVSLDVVGNWSIAKRSFEKVSGTHQVISESDDFFGFGKCQWQGGTDISKAWNKDGDLISDIFTHDSSSPVVGGYGICVKNSDDSPMPLEYSFVDMTLEEWYNSFVFTDDVQVISESISIYPSDDCEDYISLFTPDFVFSCRKDITSPITNLGVDDISDDPFRIAGSFEFLAKVQDSSLDYIESLNMYPNTFACIVSKVNWKENSPDGEYLTCYPNSTAKADYDMSLGGNLITYDNVAYNVSYDIDEVGFQSGYYIINYFSEDVSHNLEVVKSLHVLVDASPPNLGFSFSNVSYEIYEDEWRTNLTVNMFVSPDSKIVNDDTSAFCTAGLYFGDVNVYQNENLQDSFGSSWLLNFTGMIDGLYALKYECVDGVGNIAKDDIPILIQGDKSLLNPRPRGTLSSENVEIAIETGLPAECRYLRESESLDETFALPHADFPESVFESMIKFSNTGTADSSTTMHFSDLKLSHGFYRYYVKCNIFDKGIYGNAGDEIVFAVDAQPPVTSHTADGSYYNGWYNSNVNVKLSCSDPVILGSGLDWSFGCDATIANTTRYCIGEGCWESTNPEAIINYTYKGFQLTESTMISYYSQDNGYNKEKWVKDVLFQIDKTAPNITIKLMSNNVEADVKADVETDVEADVVRINNIYKVLVSSDKPFISPSIDSPTLVYKSSPSKFNGMIQLFPTEDPSVWEGAFFLKNINANKGFEGDLIFTSQGIDSHNNSGVGVYTIRIDTAPPEQPVLEPSLAEPSQELSEYQELGYPINFIDGVYYTPETSLFITGFTGESTVVSAIIGVGGVDSVQQFYQVDNNVSYEDVVLLGFESSDEIKVQSDITSEIAVDQFIGFKNEDITIGPRKDYGAYGTFYGMSSVNYVAGDEDYTLLYTNPVLQELVKLNTPVLFYENYHPNLWFGIDIPLSAFKENTFYIKAVDDVGNMIRYPLVSDTPSRLTFFSDPNPPVVVARQPQDGSTAYNTFPISLIVKEGKFESGVWNESIEFIINGVKSDFTISHDEELESIDSSNYYFRITHDAVNLADGVYVVQVEATDKALNPLDQSLESSEFFIDVDTRYPFDPDFSLVNGFKSQFGGNRWFAKSSPDFIINFSNEVAPVNITDISMVDSLTEGEAAICEEVNGSTLERASETNIFLCKFTSPKTVSDSYWADYGVVVKAFKTLTDGSDSPVGTYGPFEFTVDDKAPIYDFFLSDNTAFSNNMTIKKRFMDNINLSVFAVVVNEHHPLAADLFILGKHYTPYYSNNNGEFYQFTWEVPDYDKSQEGYTDLTLTLSDFAGNKRSVTEKVYVDLTAPRVEDINIDFGKTVIIAGEPFTGNSPIVISGEFVDEDVSSVMIVPNGYNETTGIPDNKFIGSIYFDKNGNSKSFSVNVSLPISDIDPINSPFLYNEMLINSINKIYIYVEDIAGHVSKRQLRVVRDTVGPLEPMFCIGENNKACDIANPISESQLSLNSFDDKFLNCVKGAKYTAELGDLLYQYEILGPSNTSRCRIKSKYLEMPNPEVVNKEMICSYDNSLEFLDAVEEIMDSFSEELNPGDCTGSLYNFFSH